MDPRLIALLQMMQKPVRRFDNGGYLPMDDGTTDDILKLIGGGYDQPIDFGGIDLSNLFDSGEIDTSNIFGDAMDDYTTEGIQDAINALVGGNTGGGGANNTVARTRSLTFGGTGGGGADNTELISNLGDEFLDQRYAQGSEEASLAERYGPGSMYGGPSQEEMRQGITATGNVQNAGGDTVIVNDDGTALGFSSQTGEPYELSKEEVDKMVKAGVLNCYASGYNTLTGGNKIAPGGGKEVTTSDGKKVTVMPDGKVVGADGRYVTNTNTVRDAITRATGGGGTQTGSQSNMSWLLPLLLMMLAMNRNQGQGTSQAVIPKLSASQAQLPYQQVQQAPGYRPGQGGVRYVSDVQYKPMADGGITSLMARGGTRGLLHGAGDGVSDSIPATIGGTQPARLARGEFVVDARTVSELGNGSTEAGAERLYEMMNRVHSARKKAKRGQDTKASKYLPG